MKLNKFILDLLFFRLNGYKYIDFYVNEDIPPASFPCFIDRKYRKTITLCDFYK